MTYSIIGLGKIGTSIAEAFARVEIEVAVAGRRSTQTLAPLAAKIGPLVRSVTIADAANADVIFLAIPFAAHRELAPAAGTWDGKIVVDAMNAFGVPLEDLAGLPSTAAVAKALPGARLVKAFNHLEAAIFAEAPTLPKGGRRVVFVSSDNEAASQTVSQLIDRLGFAPVELGSLDEGGLLVQARGRTWGRLVFQDLAKFN